MTATNHALTGAVLGLAIGNPWIAIPVAFVSHFLLDALPHYGPSHEDIGSSRFRNYLIIDASLCVLLVALLASIHPANWMVGAASAFTATSPDLMWLPDFLRARRGGQQRNRAERSSIVRLHAFVQWYQKPLGAITEVMWFIAAVTTLGLLVR